MRVAQNGDRIGVVARDGVWGQMRCPFGDVTLCIHDSGGWHVMSEGMTESLREADEMADWLEAHMKEHENAKE